MRSNVISIVVDTRFMRFQEHFVDYLKFSLKSGTLNSVWIEIIAIELIRLLLNRKMALKRNF